MSILTPYEPKCGCKEKPPQKLTSYTIVKGKSGDGVRCTGPFCKENNNYSIAEFGGFCETCWINLKPEQRAAILGTDTPIVQVTVPPVTVNIPPIKIDHMYYRVRRSLSALWMLSATAAIVYLYYVQGLLPKSLFHFWKH